MVNITVFVRIKFILTLGLMFGYYSLSYPQVIHYNNRGIVYERMGEMQKAQADFQKA